MGHLTQSAQVKCDENRPKMVCRSRSFGSSERKCKGRVFSPRISDETPSYGGRIRTGLCVADEGTAHDCGQLESTGARRAYRLSSQADRVRIPHESLCTTRACRRVGALTCTQGFWVQLPAGPLTKKTSGVKCNGWHTSLGTTESGSVPTHPTMMQEQHMVVEGGPPISG